MKNQIAKALVERIIEAAREGRKFKVRNNLCYYTPVLMSDNTGYCGYPRAPWIRRGY